MDVFTKGRDIQQKLGKALDIPNDIILDLPKINLMGNIQFYLENHRGIIEYTPEKVRISVSIGEVEVKGSALMIRTISKDDVRLDGLIDAVCYRG